MNKMQLIALGIFILSYGLIISNKVNRTIASLIGAILVYIFILQPKELLHYENWETVIFIFGMMTVIATMQESGFFRWLGLHAAKIVKFDPLKLFILFPFISGFLAAFVDSITVMLFMATLTIEVSETNKMNPLPLIFSEICAANIGGASTMVGDPPNVILGTYFHLSFIDFVKNTGIIAIFGFILNTAFFIMFYRKDIFPIRNELKKNMKRVMSEIEKIHPKEAIADYWLFFVGLFCFFYVVILLITHHITGLSVATIAVTGGCLALFLGGEKMGEVLERVDFSTILFFACLFLIVGGMEHVGLLKMAAEIISESSGGSFVVAISIILWFAAIGSSVVDNVPFAATLAPILKYMSLNFGFPLHPLIWSTALGTDIGGNGTPIGASANVVAIATYERFSGEKISWAYYCKSCYPAMLLVILLCNILLYLIYT
jgi:Na+/H+ antiporter NhaD/arsenite permease-like protein